MLYLCSAAAIPLPGCHVLSPVCWCLTNGIAYKGAACLSCRKYHSKTLVMAAGIRTKQGQHMNAVALYVARAAME